MASSHGLLWMLGAPRLGLGDGSVNHGHQLVPTESVNDFRVTESVHGLRASGKEFLQGQFTKQSEGQVVLSRGWSRPKLQNVQGHHDVGRAGLGVLPAEWRGGKHGPLQGRALCLLILANPILKSLLWTQTDVSNRSVSNPFMPRAPKRGPDGS